MYELRQRGVALSADCIDDFTEGDSMRRASGYVFGIGIGLVLLSILNHYIFRVNLITYTTKIAFALGVVIAVVGAVLALVGGSKVQTQ
jgi:hypothetical protein